MEQESKEQLEKRIGEEVAQKCENMSREELIKEVDRVSKAMPEEVRLQIATINARDSFATEAINHLENAQKAARVIMPEIEDLRDILSDDPEGE